MLKLPKTLNSTSSIECHKMKLHIFLEISTF